MAPIYVYLPKNGKFVAVKTPLQYFTPQDIQKLKAYESFYLPGFIDQLAPFQKAGEAVRALLEMVQRNPIQTNQGRDVVTIQMPQHELDDAVLRVLGPLWSGGARIEPFFLCFLANEVCLPFPGDVLTSAFESSAELFELALLRASLGVFLALHIGYSNPASLTAIRGMMFSDTMNGKSASDSVKESSLLQTLVWKLLTDASTKEISLDSIQAALNLDQTGGKVSRKLLSRLDRVVSDFIEPGSVVGSLFGEKGICDE
jgi:hypothetical protein